MNAREYFRWTGGALWSRRQRSSLTAAGIAVGVAAVVLLTSIGEGVHRFVLAEFTQFGTRLVAVTPGRTTTHGISGAILGTVRPLTLEDAEALRRVRSVEAACAVVQGNAAVESAERARRTTVIGVGADMPAVWSIDLASGRFLPRDDPRRARTFAVLGAKLKRELFGQSNPLGARVRIGGDRYRVVGVTEPKGQLLGFDLDDVIYIPVARALDLFNREGVMEIDVAYGVGASAEQVAAGVRQLLVARHGQEDFTVTTQEQMLDVLGSVLNVLTFAVAALGGVSLLVGGIGILTIMTIGVTERTGEIGLLRALGASRRQVLSFFLGEATILSAAGGLVGLAAGTAGAHLVHLFVPGLPVHTPWDYVVLAEVIAIAIGIAAGVWPARRAARLDPVEALRSE